MATIKNSNFVLSSAQNITHNIATIVNWTAGTSTDTDVTVGSTGIITVHRSAVYSFNGTVTLDNTGFDNPKFSVWIQIGSSTLQLQARKVIAASFDTTQLSISYTSVLSNNDTVYFYVLHNASDTTLPLLITGDSKTNLSVTKLY